MKILGVTGSRAEFGILRLVFQALKADPRFDFQLAVTGQHWSPGSTSVSEIEAAGLTVDYKVDMGLSDGANVASALCAATGQAVAGAGAVYDACQPDMVLVLGDRYEILAFAFAALLSRVPLAHLSGGDVTEGAFDDSIRHALTKLSAVHFAFTRDAVGRICQMGEDPAHVHFTGSPAIDAILQNDILDRAAFGPL
ncbi:MAG: UDP-N-acetylglucosamine 2-epimerase, partial [Pseudomonadota bacterium]